MGQVSREAPGLAAGVAVMTYFLLPARLAALRGDDALVFSRHGMVAAQGRDVIDLLADALTRSLIGGRVNILGSFQGEATIWMFENHAGAYRWFLILLTCGVGGAAYRFLRQFGLSGPLAFLAVIVLAASIQFRSYHDPVLGYYGTTQLTVICLLLSLTSFLSGLRGDTVRRDMTASAILFVVACLLNDWAYSLSVLYLGIALLERRGRSAWRPAAPFLAITALLVAAALVARQRAIGASTGYQASFSIASLAVSWFGQLFPPLPMTNLLFEHNIHKFFAVPGDPTRGELIVAASHGVVAAVLVVVVILRVAREPLPRVSAARLAAIGALVLVLPPALIAAAPKYQAELNPAKGYLETLAQVAGWSFMLTAAAIVLVRWAASRGAAAVAAAAVLAGGTVGGFAAVNGFNNARVVALEIPIAKTRELLVRSAGRGLFSSLPPEVSMLFSDRDFRWSTGTLELEPAALGWILQAHTGTAVDARIVDASEMSACGSALPTTPGDCRHLRSAVAWVRVRARPSGGAVVIGLAPSVASSAPSTAPAARVLAYVEDGGRPRPPTIHGTDASGRPWNSDGSQWVGLGRGRGWALYASDPDPARSPTASSLDDPRGVVDFTVPRTPGEAARLFPADAVLP